MPSGPTTPQSRSDGDQEGTEGQTELDSRKVMQLSRYPENVRTVRDLHRKSSRIRAWIGFRSHRIRLAGIFKPDCLSSVQRKRPLTCLLDPAGRFPRVRLKCKRCRITGLRGLGRDFQRKKSRSVNLWQFCGNSLHKLPQIGPNRTFRETQPASLLTRGNGIEFNYLDGQ